MGEFTQNLLKLSEFPFSYSLIGLLALIFGQGTNLEELSFAKIGPLLILMGFVATTMSICDPVGAIQGRIIKCRRINVWDTKDTYPLDFPVMFGVSVRFHFPLAYLFAILFSPEDMKKRYKTIDWTSIESPIFLKGELYEKHKGFDLVGKTMTLTSVITKGTPYILLHLLEGLKEHTVKTKWITAEIDRITALIYFIVIISLFIAATQFSPVFLQNFAQFFGDIKSAKLGILIFSILALIAVSIMFILRILGLRAKALTVFKYLIALETIKTDRENFKVTLQDIERYLDDNNWTLAEYWTERIQKEYKELFLEKIKELKK